MHWKQPSLWATTLSNSRLRRNRKAVKRKPAARGRRLGVEALESRQLLSITVDTLLDENNDLATGGKSLREALAFQRHAARHADSSNSPPNCVAGRLQLQHGQLVVASDVDIRGIGLNLTIDAQRANRVFYVGNAAGSVDATIRGLTITGGGNVDKGGGIYSDHARLTLDSVRVTNNRTYATGHTNGGGIYSDRGSLFLENTSVDNNQSRYGGGLEVRLDGNDLLRVLGSSIVGNQALNDNAGMGGGFFVSSTSTATHAISRTTISGNQANNSGGIRLEGSSLVLIANSTITDNHVTGSANAHAGGLAILGIKLYLYNTIVAGNSAANGFHDVVAWNNGRYIGSRNLIGDVGNAGLNSAANVILGHGVSPGLSPLGNFGGNTLTHVPLPGSPAIDRGVDIVTDLADQRGVLRRFDQPSVPNGPYGFIDIGAVEAGLVVTTAADEVVADDQLSLREALQLANAAPPAQAPIRIEFSPLLVGATIRLANARQLNISNSVQIVGPGAALLTIDAQSQSRVFQIDDGSPSLFTNVELVGLTISNGLALGLDGGGIHNSENLTLRRVVVQRQQGPVRWRPALDGRGRFDCR